jgi:uncharacterized membrane protein
MAREIFKYLIPIYLVWFAVHLAYFMHFIFSNFGQNTSPFGIFNAPGFGALMLSHVLVIVLGLAFTIYMVVDCAKRKFKESNMKIIWIIIIVFFNTFGSIIYYYIYGKNPPEIA